MSITSEIINPEALSSSEREPLIAELYATHLQIFEGVSQDEFARYVVESPAERTRIQIERDRGRIVGYFAVHTFVREIDGQRWVVVRAESGKLPGYRRGGKASLMALELARACVLYPRARKAFLGCFVHPSAYLALGHVAPQLYPHWREPTPEPVRSAMRTLAGDFGLDPADPACSGVRKVGWITRESDEERASWARRGCEMSRFYLAQNPGYRQGSGLLVLLPLNLRNLVEGLVRHGRRLLQRVLRGRPGRPGPGTSTRQPV